MQFIPFEEIKRWDKKEFNPKFGWGEFKLFSSQFPFKFEKINASSFGVKTPPVTLKQNLANPPCGKINKVWSKLK